MTLEEYLQRLIGHEENGVIVYGSLSEDEVATLYESLKPGAFLFLVSTEEDALNWKTACFVEDAGFEIRDCLILKRNAEGFVYSPKASREERDAGCEHLRGVKGAEAVRRQEGTAGVSSPSAGTSSKVKNFHPTVKPKVVMEALLDLVPENSRVFEPFLGSGSTAISACGRDVHLVGTEKEEKYFKIAEARLKYWGEIRGSIISIGGEIEDFTVKSIWDLI